MLMLPLLAVLAVAQPPAPDSLRTSDGALFVLTGDTLLVERKVAGTTPKPTGRVRYLVRGDTVVRLEPKPSQAVNTAMSVVILKMVSELSEGRKYRKP